MSAGSAAWKLDPDEVVGLFQTRPAMVVYRGDYDSEALHQKIGALSREIAGKLLPSEESEYLDVVLYSILNVLTERFSSEHVTQNKTFVVFNRETTEAAYDLLASNLRNDPKLAPALSRAWISKLWDFIRAEAAKHPEMPVDNFVFEAAETFRVTTLLAARMLVHIARGSNWKGFAGTSDDAPRTHPPLTREELDDIHRGIEEIRTGKAKHFKNIGETLNWLHRDRKIAPEGAKTPDPSRE